MTFESSTPAEQPDSNAHHNAFNHERSPIITWLGLAAIALLLVAYLVFRDRLLTSIRGERHPAVGRKLAVVDLQPLTGVSKPVTDGDLNGRVTLLNVWGTWCPPCATEFPYLAAIWQRFQKNDEFQYFSVSCRHDGEDAKNLDELRDDTAAFLTARRADHPTYFDPQFATRTSLEMLGSFQGYPTTVVLDRNGIIRGVWESPDGVPQAEKLVAQLLSENGDDSKR